MEHSEVISNDPDNEESNSYTYQFTRVLNKDKLITFLKSLTPENAAIKIQKRINSGNDSAMLSRREFLEKAGAIAKATGAAVAGTLVAGIIPALARQESSVDDLVEELEQQLIFMYRNTTVHEGFVIRTINTLGDKGGDKAVDALLKLLKDENNNVRAAAVQALNKLRVSKGRLVEGYIEVFKVNAYNGRFDAVEALGNLGDLRAVEPLIQDLDGQLPEKLGLKIIEALGKLKDKRAIPILFKSLQNNKPGIRKAAKEMLIQFGVPKEQLVDAYIDILMGGYLDVMPEAAVELGKLGDKRAIDPLIVNLYDHHRDIREAVREALIKLGVDPGKVQLRKFWLEHPYFVNTVATAGGVGVVVYSAYQLWTRYTTRGNMYQLTHQEYKYRDRAAEFLERKEGPRVVELLFQQLEEGYFYPQHEKLLNRMLDHYSFEDLQKLMRFKSPQARVFIMRALGKLQDERAVNLLVEGANDDSPEVRLVALDALLKRQYSQKLALFLKGVIDQDSRIRKLSAGALGDLKDPRANDVLMVRLSDNFEVQDVARRALEKINGPFFISDLEPSNDPRKIYVLLGILRRVTQAEQHQDLISLFEEEVKTSFMEPLWTRIKSELPKVENPILRYDALGEAILLQQQGYDFKLDYRESIYNSQGTFDGSSMSWMSETTPESLTVSRGTPLKLTDKAVLADNKDVGGIDMNNIEVTKQGQGSSIQFDPMDMDAVMKENIQGFVPVIINVTPVNSILPILGLEPPKNKEEYEVSQLN